MNHPKCSRCQRRGSCALQSLAVQTLPWVDQTLQENHGSDWERFHSVYRTLRGFGGSPGFVEDWLFEGAMTQDDVTTMINAIVSRGEVELAVLCQPCRHYLGPSIIQDESALPA